MIKQSREMTAEILALLRNATEAAAHAASLRIADGHHHGAGAAAAGAMGEVLSRFPYRATIVGGQAAEGDVPTFYDGQVFGKPDSEIEFDLAVDPGEGTTYVVEGLTNAMSVAALAPRGAMREPKPGLYMEKFAAPAAAAGEIGLDWEVERKLAALAKLLGKDVQDLTIFVLEKPRHRDLIDQIEETGAGVASYPAGDVAAALLATFPSSKIDALMGTGGVREGLVSACAARALGAEFSWRLDPQLQSELAAVREAGLARDEWHSARDLVASENTYVCATGIASGLLLEGVARASGEDRFQTLTIADGERKLMTTWRPSVGEGAARS
jgi:fructose-1,6-bisphosphatase II